MKINRRKRIILGMTVLALIYAGAVFLFSAPGSNVSEFENDSDSVQEFVKEVIQSLAKYRRTETEQIILEKAQIPWPAEPFIPAAISSSIEQGPAVETITNADPESFNFTGYLEIGSKRLAIINGEEYETGDRISGSSFTVRGISPEQVLLGDAGNRIRTIPMADDRVP